MNQDIGERAVSPDRTSFGRPSFTAGCVWVNRRDSRHSRPDPKSCCLRAAFSQTECVEAPLAIMTAKNHNPWTIGWFAALLVLGSVAGRTLEPRTVSTDSIWDSTVS